jgi:FdhD protein
VLTRRFAQGRLTRLPDELAVEEPLSIRLDDTLVTTTMRTPGNDFELAAGFCLTEGLLAGATIRQMRYCSADKAEKASLNVVTVDTGGTAPTPTPRVGLLSSSSGICGSESIDALCARLRPVARGDIPISVLADISSRLEGLQPLFAKTGAVHVAAVFDAHGTISVVREDIGRHNAVDKVIGQLLLDEQLPATGLGLFVSGRASFEIVQKAWVAGFAAVVAMSAPSALAVDTARAAGITLVGFARERHFNLYTDAGHESVAP